MSTSISIDTSEVAATLCARVSSAIVLPDEALTMKNEVDRPTVSTLKGVELNLEVLRGEVLHLLQDGVIAELRAHEHHALQVINEQQINNE